MRSTEMTWPPSVFGLIESEILSIEKKTTGSSDAPKSRFFIFSALFQSDGDLGPEQRRSKSLKYSTYTLMLISMAMSVAMVLSIDQIFSTPLILDEDQLVLREVSVESLYEQWGRAEAVNQLVAGRYFRQYDAFAGGGETGLFSSIKALLSSHYLRIGTCFGILFGIYMWACYRHAKLVDRHHLARIFIEDVAVTPRAKPSMSEGLLTSFIIGGLASVFVTLFLSSIGVP